MFGVPICAFVQLSFIHKPRETCLSIVKTQARRAQGRQLHVVINSQMHNECYQKSFPPSVFKFFYNRMVLKFPRQQSELNSGRNTRRVVTRPAPHFRHSNSIEEKILLSF